MPQYTQCIAPERYRSGPWLDAFLFGGIAGFGAFITDTLIVAIGGGAGSLAGATATSVLIGLVGLGIRYAHWWLYGRLICLPGGDRCVIGMILSLEPDSGWPDTDYCINLLLPPAVPGTPRNTVLATSVDRNLLDEHPETERLGRPLTGYEAAWCDYARYGTDTCPLTEALHCEFEGAGVKILYDYLRGILALLIAATVGFALCLIPVIGWIACLIAWIFLGIALAVALIGLAVSLSDSASPSDVNPSLGELHQNGLDGMGADIVLVHGTWVYDAGASDRGWNEIHPIKYCQWIGTWSGVWPFADPQTTRDEWCAMTAGASWPLTVANQKLPQHQWTTHPLVDGCQPEEEPTLI